MLKGRSWFMGAFLAGQVLAAVTAHAAGPYAPGAAAPPAAAPPAQSGGGYVVVIAPEADVLADPRGGATVLLKGYKGDLFPVREQQGEWFHVTTGDTTAGWIRRGSAALLMYPEFLDPVRLRESYTPPPYVSPRAYGYSGSGYGRVPYPWQDPLWWGLWYYDQKHFDDDHDDHHHDGHDGGHGHGDHNGRGGGGHRHRPQGQGPNQPAPSPPRDPRVR